MNQHVEKCAPPEPQFTSPDQARDDSMYSDDSYSLRGGPPYAPSQHEHSIQSPTSADFAGDSSVPNKGLPDLERGPRSSATHVEQPTQSTNPRASSPVESAAQAYARSYVESLRATSTRIATPPPGHPRRETELADNVLELDAIPAVAALHAPPGEEQMHSNQSPYNSQSLTTVNIQRKPNANPVLAPEYRYCWRDEIIKPPRTHHCRICGTVSVFRYAVMAWDHNHFH